MVEAGSQYYLITNRHLLSGRNISAHEPQEQIVEPYILKTSLHIYGGEGETSQPLSMGIRKRITVQLYDENSAPRWLESQTKAQQRQMVDVVALPVDLNQFLSLSSGRITGMHLTGLRYPPYRSQRLTQMWNMVLLIQFILLAIHWAGRQLESINPARHFGERPPSRLNSMNRAGPMRTHFSSIHLHRKA